MALRFFSHPLSGEAPPLYSRLFQSIRPSVPGLASCKPQSYPCAGGVTVIANHHARWAAYAGKRVGPKNNNAARSGRSSSCRRAREPQHHAASVKRGRSFLRGGLCFCLYLFIASPRMPSVPQLSVRFTLTGAARSAADPSVRKLTARENERLKS
ncbi:hypothetical protein MHYP_G00338230 [Metynnis hypsauchen]